jgi:hypothetical protein
MGTLSIIITILIGLLVLALVVYSYNQNQRTKKLKREIIDGETDLMCTYYDWGERISATVLSYNEDEETVHLINERRARLTIRLKDIYCA